MAMSGESNDSSSRIQIGRTILHALLNGSENERRKVVEALLAPVDVGLEKDSHLMNLLRAQQFLLGSSRERLAEILRGHSAGLVPLVARAISVAVGADLRILLEFAKVIPSPALVPVLAVTIESGDRWAGVFAIQALSAIKSAEAVTAIVSALKFPGLRWGAIAELADIKAKDTVKDVAPLLKDPSVHVRKEAIRAMVEFDDKRILPVLVRISTGDESPDVRSAAVIAVRRIAASNNVGLDEAALVKASARVEELTRPIDRLLQRARMEGASDVHIVPGSPVAFRIHGELVSIGDAALTPVETSSMLREVLPDRFRARLEEYLDADFSHEVPGVGRNRINLFMERQGLSAVVRLIPSETPVLSSLGLPARIKDIVSYQQGLVLVTGRSGSGKSTTQAAMIDLINDALPVHIITLEDPIEYIHERKRGLVNQREIGIHTESFATALRSALREDPDVLVVGEMRDLVTMRRAVEAAETGHLVIATLHTPTAVGAIQRLIESFPATEQQQVRLMLSDSLRMVIAQTLIRRKDGNGRVGAFELMVMNPAVSALIRENKLNQVAAIMQVGRTDGMRTMDDALMELVVSQKIDAEEAFARAQNKEPFNKYVKPEMNGGPEPTAHR